MGASRARSLAAKSCDITICCVLPLFDILKVLLSKGDEEIGTELFPGPSGDTGNFFAFE
jgi:hypothetical protein